ncbi:MAG TPA: hypothetical protein VJX67_01525, partial [Blastocatellia bacterium]|nr:hypothetical protein [Blastocatellia bacterium]
RHCSGWVKSSCQATWVGEDGIIHTGGLAGCGLISGAAELFPGTPAISGSERIKLAMARTISSLLPDPAIMILIPLSVFTLAP